MSNILAGEESKFDFEEVVGMSNLFDVRRFESDLS